MYYSVFWQYKQNGTWFNSCDHCTNYARGIERFEQMQSLAEEMPHAYRKVTRTFEDPT